MLCILAPGFLGTRSQALFPGAKTVSPRYAVAELGLDAGSLILERNQVLAHWKPVSWADGWTASSGSGTGVDGSLRQAQMGTCTFKRKIILLSIAVDYG